MLSFGVKGTSPDKGKSKITLQCETRKDYGPGTDNGKY
jgi:hypothetical protein